MGDHVRGEVDDLFQVLRREVEQVTEPARHTLEVPDVGDRRGQLDVTHPLTAHLGAGDFDATALTDDALEADALVLAAVALPVPGRTEDLLAEEPVLFRLERAVVDGLRLLDLTVRPLPDVVRRGEADTKVVEEVDVQHLHFPWLDPDYECGRAAPGYGAAQVHSDLFNAAWLTPRQVDSEFLSRTEHVFIGVPHFDRRAVARQHLDVKAER